MEPGNCLPLQSLGLDVKVLDKNNDEIARSLTIKETTLQKHIQNIFRKCQVSSKWELLRLLS